MTMRIIFFRNRPFAYAQDYEVHAWPQAHFADLPRGARAIDSFIGAPSMIGRGHGAAYLRLLAELLRAEGAPLVAIDPDIGNLRARRAYARAGFSEKAEATTGSGPVVLMIYERSLDTASRPPAPKLGISGNEDSDLDLVRDLLQAMHENAADFTLTFRRLCAAAADETADAEPRGLFANPGAYDSWASRWRSRLALAPCH